MSNTLKYILVGVAGVVIGFLALSYFSSVPVPVASAPSGGDTNYGGSLTVEDLTTSADTTHGTTGALTVAGAASLIGTTSPAQVLFPVGSSISTVATGTPRTVYANTTGPKLCFESSAALAVRNRGNFSPSLVFSIGTSSASVTTTNLISSSTVSTSTPGTSFFRMVPSGDTDAFILENGDEIMGIIGDITNTEASSTNMTNLTADFRVLCSELEI